MAELIETYESALEWILYAADFIPYFCFYQIISYDIWFVGVEF